jgi:hypothetical protein
MKKHILFLSGAAALTLSVFAGKLTAQITLTQANMATIGTKAVIAYDTVPTVMPGSPGPSQTWNFSALKNQKASSLLFVNASTTPYFTSFPSSNLADSTIGTKGDTYFIVNSGTFEGVGSVQSFMGYTASVAVNPPFVQLTLPATYGTEDIGSTAGGAKLAISYLVFDSGRVKVNVNYSDTVDAYGVMTTPYAPGGDTVLRQKHHEQDIDSIWVHSTFSGWAFYQASISYSNAYRFYTDKVQYTFVQMNMDSAFTNVKSVQWFSGVDAGINEVSNSGATVVYPNPCKTQITFKCSSANAKQVSVFDIAGRQLSTQEIRNGILNMNTSGYSAGMYFYRISDVSGNILDRGKFSVQ